MQSSGPPSGGASATEGTALGDANSILGGSEGASRGPNRRNGYAPGARDEGGEGDGGRESREGEYQGEGEYEEEVIMMGTEAGQGRQGGRRGPPGHTALEPTSPDALAVSSVNGGDATSGGGGGGEGGEGGPSDGAGGGVVVPPELDRDLWTLVFYVALLLGIYVG